MSAAFRPGPQTKPAPNPVDTAAGKPSPAAPTQNAAQAKFGGKQPAFLNAKAPGMDFGGTVYGAKKTDAGGQAGKAGPSPGLTGKAPGPAGSGVGVAPPVVESKPAVQPPQQQQTHSPGAGFGTKFQPKSPLLQNLPQPGAKPAEAPPAQQPLLKSVQPPASQVLDNKPNNGPGSRFQPKSPFQQNSPQAGKQAETAAAQKTSQLEQGQTGQHSNGLGAQLQTKSPQPQVQANKTGPAGFGTQFQPKSPLLQNTQPGNEQAAGAQQKPATVGLKATDLSINPQQQLSTNVQQPKLLGQKFGQKPPEQPLVQQKQQQQLSQPFGVKPTDQNLAQKQVQQPQNLAGVQQQQQILQQNAPQQFQSLAAKPQEQPAAKPFQQTQILGARTQEQQPIAAQLPPQISAQIGGGQKPQQPPPVAPKPSVVGPVSDGSGAPLIRPSQILQINPSEEIKFEGPFNALTSVELILTNPTSQAVCYKIKSNTPHYYFVKPAGDLIEPHQNASVYLMLQTPAGEKNPTTEDNHKFLIQSIIVQDMDSAGNGLERLWKSVRQEEIMETKLPCVFVDAPYRPPVSSSYLEERSYERSAVEEDKKVNKAAKKQKEAGSSSWVSLLIVPVIILLIAFAVYKLHFEKK